MEIKVELEQLRQRSIFLGVPMFGGNCTGNFCRSVMDLAVICKHYGVQLNVYYLFNESLIQRARNYIADEFMRSNCTHLLFIDADISFDPNDVITMLALQSDDSPYDVLGGPYPKKVISWEKIKAAVDKGAADLNPENLSEFVGDYVFNPIVKPGISQIRLDEPAEVAETGTGFMMIRRATLEKYRDAYPHMMYKPDHARTEHFDGSREICAFFDVSIDPVSRRLLSEDYKFCMDVQKMGGKVWLLPWMKCTHTGTYTFGGSLAALASIGVHATADPSKLIKNKTQQRGSKSKQ